MKTISFVPFAIRSGWCNQTFSIALFPKGFSILMQSLGLFVTFTSVSLTMCLTDVSEKDEIDAVVGSLVSLVWYADTDCVFSLLVFTSKTNTVDNFGSEGEEKPKDFAAIVFFSGVWSYLKDKIWWICRTKEDFFLGDIKLKEVDD